MRLVEFRKQSFIFVWKEANVPRVIWLEITILLKRAF